MFKASANKLLYPYNIGTIYTVGKGIQEWWHQKWFGLYDLENKVKVM